MKIYIIRHGKPVIKDNNFYESYVEDLEPIKELKNKLPKPDIVYSSPYNRCIDTAKVFSKDFKILNFLKEWNLQSLNLPDSEYFEQEQLGWNNFNKVVQGNESLNQAKERFTKGIKSLKQAETIFLISSGTVMNMFCSELAQRKPKIQDIQNMKYLAYAIVNDMKLIKDLI